LACYGVLRGWRKIRPGVYRQGQSDAVCGAAAAIAGGEVRAREPGFVGAAILTSKNDFSCSDFEAGNDAALVGAVSACYKSVAVRRP
jgi:hypothetical protein